MRERERERERESERERGKKKERERSNVRSHHRSCSRSPPSAFMHTSTHSRSVIHSLVLYTLCPLVFPLSLFLTHSPTDSPLIVSIYLAFSHPTRSPYVSLSLTLLLSLTLSHSLPSPPTFPSVSPLSLCRSFSFVLFSSLSSALASSFFLFFRLLHVC